MGGRGHPHRHGLAVSRARKHSCFWVSLTYMGVRFLPLGHQIKDTFRPGCSLPFRIFKRRKRPATGDNAIRASIWTLTWMPHLAPIWGYLHFASLWRTLTGQARACPSQASQPCILAVSSCHRTPGVCHEMPAAGTAQARPPWFCDFISAVPWTARCRQSRRFPCLGSQGSV